MNIEKENIDLDLLFGKDRAQEDQNLEKYFVKTQHYLQAKSGGKEIVLGRKGSGKSAIFRILQKDLLSENKDVISITPSGEDFFLIDKKLAEMNNMVIADDYKYSIIWKDFILNEICLSVLKDIRFTINNPLKKYLIQEGIIQRSFLEKFTSSVMKVLSTANVKYENLEFNIDFSTLLDKSSDENIEIVSYLRRVLSQKEYYVLFDNLDEPWKNNPDMNSWLRGLVLCTRQLKRSFTNLRIVIFLRDDIFAEISKGSDIFDSRSEILSLNWYERNSFSLKKMLTTRIAVYFEKPIPKNYYDMDDLWKILYPNQIEYNTSRAKKSIYTTKYIIDRTFARPRELIQYCRLVLQDSTDRFFPVTQNAIRTAEYKFTDWKITDLVGEYSKTYNNIDKTIFHFAGKTSNWNMAYSALNDLLAMIPDNDKIINKVEDRILTLDEHIKFLFSVGFLRKRKEHDSGGFYYVTYLDELNLNPALSHFDIHPAFRKKLIRA